MPHRVQSTNWNLAHISATQTAPTCGPQTAVQAGMKRASNRSILNSRHIFFETPAHICARTYNWGLAGSHVDEAAVVTLEGDGDRRSGSVTVLGHDQVGLARPRRLLLVGILTVQQDDHVRVLLN